MTIWATTTKAGWHKWPTAPSRREYLSNSHRHLFKFRVEVEVIENDRQVEFHDVLESLTSAVGKLPLVGSDMSCEMMAERIVEILRMQYEYITEVTVSEDGECGATWRR